MLCLLKCMIKCCVPGCKPVNTETEEESGIYYFLFPKIGNLREHWINAIRSDTLSINFEPETLSVVCSRHFVKSDYIIDSMSKIERLRVDAIPSVFHDLSTYYQPNLTECASTIPKYEQTIMQVLANKGNYQTVVQDFADKETDQENLMQVRLASESSQKSSRKSPRLSPRKSPRLSSRTFSHSEDDPQTLVQVSIAPKRSQKNSRKTSRTLSHSENDQQTLVEELVAPESSQKISRTLSHSEYDQQTVMQVLVAPESVVCDEVNVYDIIETMNDQATQTDYSDSCRIKSYRRKIRTLEQDLERKDKKIKKLVEMIAALRKKADVSQISELEINSS